MAAVLRLVLFFSLAVTPLDRATIIDLSRSESVDSLVAHAVLPRCCGPTGGLLEVTRFNRIVAGWLPPLVVHDLLVLFAPAPSRPGNKIAEISGLRRKGEFTSANYKLLFCTIRSVWFFHTGFDLPLGTLSLPLAACVLLSC
jgi:hypothetical protein